MKRRQYFKKKTRKKWSKNVLLVTIALASAFVVSILSLRVYAQIAGAPPLTVPKASIFLDSQNNQIGDYYTDERRYWVSIDELSPYLIDATIAVEDKDFYEHGGFDYSRIAGALLADLKAGSKVQGASTLTQQYARNLFLTHEKTWTRKINEALYAYRLEIFYGKDEILEGYLNTVYYGHGMYGAEAASRYYFGKSSGDLTLAEAAMLAGIPKGPTYYSPLANEQKATERQQLILSLMESQGKITATEKERGVSEQLVYKSDEWIASKSIAPYFLDVVWAEASEILESQNLNISEGGWKIKTTLNQAHQQAAEQAVANHMPDSELQVGLVSMDPHTGFVTALVGGRDYGTSSFNRVTLAQRQPGSTIKPILYTAALEKGYTPMTFKDVSQTTFTYDNGRQTYTPKNVNGQFATHEMSLAQAVAISDNVYAVKTLQDIGYPSFRNVLERFQLNSTKSESPSIALGTIETSLYALTNAYNILAAGGESLHATTILSIENAKGQIVYEYEQPKNEQVVTEADAYIMTQMLTGIFDPVFSDYSPATGVSIRPKMTHTYAAKSGTTNSDQWMVGYSTHLTTGVWNGYDHGKNLSTQADNSTTKQVWIDFMEAVHKGLPNEEFVAPSTVEGVVVDITSGKIATEACPENQRLVYVKAENVPTEKCSTYWFDSDWFNPESLENSWDSLLNWLPFELFKEPAQ
ncbi:transglycosylase domain-containing protein [Lysinibacillus sp. LZ02]|uniref:transglycosylase domain-containing protein n=1 Tax=Lysinibacillus sp. LZ02 TaxID=3420668 RepID=UPI003D35DF3C